MTEVSRSCHHVLGVVVLAAVLSAVPLSLGAQTPPGWAQEVNQKWYAAFSAGDAAGLMKLYVAYAVLLLPDRTLRGRAAIEAYQSSNFQKTSYSCKWAIDSVQSVGRQAAVLGHDTCVESPKAGGAGKTVNNRWLTVFERQPDGSWMIARDTLEEVKPGSRRKVTVTAEVFLRSVSGRSFREIAHGSLPEVLSPYRPADGARTAVHRFLTRAGFDVCPDEAGLALTIEGPPATFARVFGVEAAHLTQVRAHETVSLRCPLEVQELVEEIVVLPKPEFF